jgi:hypothetical protein
MIKLYPFIIFGLLYTQVPLEYNLLVDTDQLNRYDNNSIKGQIANNAVIDIKSSGDSLYFLGTGNGLSYGEIIDNDSIDFGYFNISTMPRGGNPALAVDGKSIAVSGVIDTAVATGTEPKGTGIAFSTDQGENWTYLPQPIDEIPLTGEYHAISWGGQDISALAVTTEINNVSYDLAIYDNYIYSASWAGGLRRYPIGMITENQNRQWEIIPLPRDYDLDLYCDAIDTSYYLNPRDPADSGYHNHKGFSVYVNDGIVWAGTAAGINKGEIHGDCINWVGHYSSLQNNISGNWVIGFEEQIINGDTRIWAITWSAESQGEFNALSYTDDGGDTWDTVQPAGYSEKVYNLYANENRIWAASESGLYVSEDGEHWGKYTRPIDDNTEEELFTESVMTTYFSEVFNWLWMGTEDGIAISNDDGISWEVHRFWEETVYSNVEKMLSAYPNPFLINDYYQVGGDGHVRFIYSNPDNDNSSIDIFDFAMDRVIQLGTSHLVDNNESEVIWNGRNEYGDQVANGVYFCRLSLNGEYYWTKLAVVN